MEKERHHYEHIVNIQTEEERIEAEEELQNLFEFKPSDIDAFELEKTPEDLEIIKITESIVDKIVLKYGGKPKSLPVEHIYLLAPDKLLEYSDDAFSTGLHYPASSKIIVERYNSPVFFSSVLAHEMFHLKGYKSARIGKSGSDIHLYRSGISMVDRKDIEAKQGDEEIYFQVLEEAIVSECVRQFLDMLSEEDLFNEDLLAFNQIRDYISKYYKSIGVDEMRIKVFEQELKYIENSPQILEEIISHSEIQEERQRYASEIYDDMIKKDSGKAIKFERDVERKKMYELLDNIVSKSNCKFEYGDVFDKLAYSHFSGNYLPFARIVEEVLGKGEFRKLAKEFSYPLEQEDKSEVNEDK